MSRRGGNSSPRSASSSPSRSPSRGYGSASTVRSPVPTPGAPAPASMVHEQRPSLFKEMAATAGGVAVGSAVGHTIGHAITGGLSGGSSDQVQKQAEAPQQTEPAGPCAWEIKQFLDCAQSQTDLTLCGEFNEAMKQCKLKYGLK